MATDARHESHRTTSLLLLSLVVATAIAFAACGGSGTTSSGSTSPAASQIAVAASPAVTASPTASVIPLPSPTVAGRIVFARDNGTDAYNDTDIYVVDSDGTGLKVLAGGEESALWPHWSPDGRRIVYEVDTTGVDRQDVWVMNADGSGKKQITDDTNSLITSRLPSWSPDGKQIVLSSWILPAGPEEAVVAVMDPDGGHFRQVTKPGEYVDYWPRWASDGRIYFYRLDASGAAAEYSVKPDGSGLKRIMKLGSLEHMLYYGISPDGSQAALQDVAADRLEVLAVDGGQAVALLDPASQYLGDIAAAVGWAPDQKALAIAGLYDNGSTRLYIVNPDGTGLSAVPGIDAARDPDWMP
jgi:TolB protein